MRQPVLETQQSKSSSIEPRTKPRERSVEALHPAWHALIRLCREIRHGEIERLVIQDGLPVLAEVTRKKVRLL